MNAEQIEKWAAEARMCCNFEWVAGIRTLTSFDATTATLTRFAELVAAAERERCARVCDDMVLYTGFDCAAAIRNTAAGHPGPASGDHQGPNSKG